MFVGPHFRGHKIYQCLSCLSENTVGKAECAGMIRQKVKFPSSQNVFFFLVLQFKVRASLWRMMHVQSLTPEACFFKFVAESVNTLCAHFMRRTSEHDPRHHKWFCSNIQQTQTLMMDFTVK